MRTVLKSFFEHWRQRQPDDNKAKLDNLLAVLEQDRHLLRHNDVAFQLIVRYQKLLAQDWRTVPFESTEDFCGRLGLHFRWSNYRDVD